MAEVKLFQRKAVQISPNDTVAVALVDLRDGDEIEVGAQQIPIRMRIPAKHKFALKEFVEGDQVVMYGVLVGKTVQPIRQGGLLTTSNTRHLSSTFTPKSRTYDWEPPDVATWKNRSILGYHRSDGQVGTRNYWLGIPLVFCENRNIRTLQDAFEKELGNSSPETSERAVADLVRLYRDGKIDEIKQYRVHAASASQSSTAVFPNIDGVKFLTHDMGCGGTRDDARTLCGLIAGYIHHPNVAGATILSLGCQNAQVSILRDELQKRDAHFDKPLLVFDQQQSNLESTMLSEAIRETFL